MILKFRTSTESNGWRWYDAQRIQVHEKTGKEWASEDGGEIDLPQNEALTSEVFGDISDETMALISFEHEGMAYNIFTSSPVYLLNDKGETIGRLRR
jgi:hypothetical protein